eukprot:6319049-Prorocentrum_lima.AAC.1
MLSIRSGCIGGSASLLDSMFKYCMSAGEPPDRICLIRDRTMAVLHAKSGCMREHRYSRSRFPCAYMVIA